MQSHGNLRVSPEAMPRFCQEDFQALLRGYEGILPGKILDFTPPKFNIAHEKWWLEDEFP